MYLFLIVEFIYNFIIYLSIRLPSYKVLIEYILKLDVYY